jgi:hypothetical protein
MMDTPRHTTLADTGQQTIALFKKLKRVDRNLNDEEWPSALFAAQAERFDLWAVNLGLLCQVTAL